MRFPGPRRGRPVVALLTDFGTTDVYVGVMKAVIAARAPDAGFVDLTHDIPPGDLRTAAFRLWQAAPWLPGGCVVLAVVDPGVGTSRRAVALSCGGLRCVGPDNGLFSYLLATRKCEAAVQIEAAVEIHAPAGSTQPSSATFHGRDVFAPSAARLCAGVPLRRLGPAAGELVRLDLPRLECDAFRWSGEVISIDRFGNAITSIGALRRSAGSIDLEPWLPVCGPARMTGTGFHAELPTGERLPLLRTFADAAPGEPLAYIGSDGLLEIGVNAGRAADRLALSVGAGITLAPG